MKKLPIFFIVFLLSGKLSAQDALQGIWLTGQENTRVETYQKDGAWYGKIISSDNPKAKIGTDILRGFKREDGEWKGKIFAAKRGKILDAVIQPTKDVLSITASMGFMSKTIEWKKEK